MYIMGRKLRVCEYDIDNIEKEAVLFIPSHNKVVVLNQSALGVLTMIRRLSEKEKYITEEMIYNEMIECYKYVDVVREEMISDIVEAIEMFKASGILEDDV